MLVTVDRTIRLAQIAPFYVILATPENLSPCDAEVVMRVDGQEDRWPVRLVEGAFADQFEVAIDPR